MSRNSVALVIPATTLLWFIVPVILTYWHLRQYVVVLPTTSMTTSFIPLGTPKNGGGDGVTPAAAAAAEDYVYFQSHPTALYQKLTLRIDQIGVGDEKVSYYRPVFAAPVNAVTLSQQLLVVVVGTTTTTTKPRYVDSQDWVCVHLVGSEEDLHHYPPPRDDCLTLEAVQHSFRWSSTFTSSRTTGTMPVSTSAVASRLPPPATCLLVAVQIVLAALYWNFRVTPAAVAQRWYRMMWGNDTPPPTGQFEIWRCWTGTTAHFEVWHLGVNMMSLMALGRELEGHNTVYSSWTFLAWNASLIPIVSAVWLVLHWAIDRYYYQLRSWSLPHRSQSQQPDESQPTTTLDQPTVGYSGVLFAWMVVASLEQSQTCPVVFWPQLCFRTYHLGRGWNFSWAPWVQLVVLQVLLPRVSLSGHLAGLVVGFALHWGLLVPLFLQPAVGIPFLYLLYLSVIRLRRWCPSWNGISADPSNGATTTTSTAAALIQRNNINNNTIFHYRAWILVGHILMPVASAMVFGITNSLTVSWMLTTLYFVWWVLLIQAPGGSYSPPNLGINTNTLDAPAVVVARGYILAAALVVIQDSMSVGSWLALQQPWTWSLRILMVARTVILVQGLLVVMLVSLPSNTDDRGIFHYTLGYTLLQPLRQLAHHPWLSTLVAAATTGTKYTTISGIDSDTHRSGNGDLESARVESSSITNGSSGKRGNTENASTTITTPTPFAGSGQRLGGAPSRHRSDATTISAGTRNLELSRLVR